MSTLTGLVERHPGTTFLAFAVLHLAVWSALPSLLYPNLPLDLIEALTYGREWQLGYDKLTPLPWWLVEFAHRAVGADFAYYTLGAVAVVAALAAVWATARALVGSAGALVAILIVDGLHYLNYTAAKFNHDVIQLPLWALAGYAFRSALREGKTGSWLLLGLALGLGFWAKYFVVVLAAPLALFVLIDRDARASLRTPGPWLAAAIAIAVVAPHLVWLATHDFLPFNYANARAAPPQGIADHLWRPAKFVLTQAFFLAPSLAIAAPLLWHRGAPAPAHVDVYDRRIVGLLAFGPAVTMVAGSLLTGRGLVAMWGYPLWLFLGLWIVIAAGAVADPIRLQRVTSVWGLVFVAFALAFVINYALLPRFDHRYRAVLFPGEALALSLSERFRAATGRPLAYVIGSMWVGGNVGHYAPEHPRVLIGGDPRRAPWIDLADLRSRGAILAWDEGDRTVVPPILQATAPGAQIQPSFTLPLRRGDGVLEVGWAILPPSDLSH